MSDFSISCAERTAALNAMTEEMNQARGAHSALESDLAGALALQQQEAQKLAKERDAALARALAAETQAAELEEANSKLFQQQQVRILILVGQYPSLHNPALASVM